MDQSRNCTKNRLLIIFELFLEWLSAEVTIKTGKATKVGFCRSAANR
jgi:hypothetical protein